MKYLDAIKSWLGQNKGLHKSRRKDEEITNLKQRIECLERLLDEKTNVVERAKSIFLKNLYHEIRTPLNAIVGFSDLIEMNSISNKEKEGYINHIRESSRDFLRKMDNIIEASIIEAGLMKLSNDECNISELLNEIYSYYSIQKHIAEKKIAFLLTIPEELKQLHIQCDSYRITQILSNLLSNAFKFTSQGIVEFGLKVVKDEVEFYVKDSGIGGLEGCEGLVYKNFSKIDESDEAKEGLGLGLSLSRKLIELMKGRIWYKSVHDKGTTFYFTIPFIPLQKNKTLKTKGSDVYEFRKSFRRSVVL
jgi:signal transduction histidine kinase